MEEKEVRGGRRSGGKGGERKGGEGRGRENVRKTSWSYSWRCVRVVCSK